MRTLIQLALVVCCLVPRVGHAEPDMGVAPDVGVAAETADPLVARIQSAYARIPELSGIEVLAGEGVVTLSGSVARAESRAAAEELARRVEGVLWVDNRVRVDGDHKLEAERDPAAADAAIRERLLGIFANVPDLRDVKLTVRVGVVRLEGEVPRPESVTKAEALAKTIDGVVYVDNELAEVRAVQQRISPAFARAREVAEKFVATLPLFAVALVILAIFLIFARLVSGSGFLFRRLDDKPLVQGIVKQVVRVVIVGIGALLILELFNLTALAGAVLGTAGVAGLALGFAFKDIVENYLASLMLSMRQPFSKDDIVRIGEYEGKVVRLSTRDTVLMTLDGNHLRIPNAVVFKAVVLNYTRNPLRRYDFVVGLGVGEDIVESMRIGLEALRGARGVLSDPAAWAVVERLGDFTVDLHFYAWIDQKDTDWFLGRSAGIRSVKEAFDAAGIDMPEPVRRVLHHAWEPPAPKQRAVRPAEVVADGPGDAAGQIDEQIAQDRASTDEKDLLE